MYGNKETEKLKTLHQRSTSRKRTQSKLLRKLYCSVVHKSYMLIMEIEITIHEESKRRTYILTSQRNDEGREEKRSKLERKELTTIAFESSWWASSSFTAILAILWERTFCRVVQSAFLQMLLGISLKLKPRRKAPVTSPKVFEQAMAKPRTLPLLFIHVKKHKEMRRKTQLAKKLAHEH